MACSVPFVCIKSANTQEDREYRIANPDFAALARAYGAAGELVTKTEEFYPAFERAVEASTPTIIEIKIHPDAISPATTLSAIREAALKEADKIA